MKRQVCEADPLRMKKRLSPKQTPGLTEVQRQQVLKARGWRNFRAMQGALEGDLEWIVRKAMAKDPQHRYASVEQLGADVQRHLGGLPVLAAPDHFGYRLKKSLMRHRMAAAVAGAMFAVSRRPDSIPDKLREVAPKYFERDGLCFAPVVEAAGGACFLNVYFQNRHARHASARIDVMPGARSFRLARHPLAEVSVRIECPGGAFGVVRVPFLVPADYQGRRVSFDVAADVKYPARRGKLLRPRGGVAVGPTSDLSQTRQLLSTLALLPLGILQVASPGRVTLRLPIEVAGDAPAPRPTPCEILWAPDASAAPTPHRTAA